MTVHGRTAFWDPQDRSLRYRPVDGVYADVVESNDDDGPHVLTRSDAVALVDGTRLVETPSDRKSWFPIEVALPLH